ncbi:flagellar filament capping protein FliD [bacterium]|nr:flagellar filament capping protein FliD [bacterium]
MGSVSFLGLASGTDWNNIIGQLTQLERRPITLLEQQRDKLLFEQSATTRINTQLGKLNTVFSSLRFESTFLTRKTSSSNPTRLSVSAEPGAPTGTHTVEVKRLASPSRVASGSDGQLYSKVANLSTSQTMGIGSVQPYGDFQPTRALPSTLIKDTLQAGKGAAQINKGDTISIAGQLKDGSAVSGTFTFNGDSSDTLQRLATTVAQVFQGQISGSIGSNGELTFIESNPAIVGDVTFNTIAPNVGLKFNDADFSGSTLSFGIGNNVAGSGATTRRLVSELTFTSAGVTQLNGATDLATLDQVTSGSLNNGDVIRISGNEQNGTAIAPVNFTYTGAAGGQTIDDLVNAISGAFGTANATYSNGKIIVTGTASGSSSLTLDLEFIDSPLSTSFALGDFAVAETGRTAAAQMITTGSFTVEGTGEHLLSASEGKAGRVRGTVTLLDPSNSLSSYGVTEMDLFSIDVDSPSGSLGPVTLTGLSEYSTLQDFVDAVNTQVPAVTAQLVNTGTDYRLELVSNQGGRNIRIDDVLGGIMDKLIKPAATTLSSSSNDLANTFAATTASDDYTIVDVFQPSNGGPVQRRIATGDEGSPVADLIGGVAINGAFQSGVATMLTANSAELNTQQDMRSYLFGSSSIAASPPGSIPFVRADVPLAQAGLATTAQNSDTSPLFHTDGFFTVNGVRINVGDVNTTSINDVLAAINSSGAGVSAFFDSANSRVYLRNNTPGTAGISLGGNGDTSNFLTITGLTSDAGGTLIAGQNKAGISKELPLAQGSFSQGVSSGIFTINGVHIVVDAGVDSLTAVIQKINRSGAGVEASYDSAADRFVLTQKLDGSSLAPRINLGDSGDTSNFLEAMQLSLDTTVSADVGSVRQSSLLNVDGIEYERSGNTIKDILEQVSLTLNAITDGPETVSIVSDNDKIKGSLIDFVVEYNTTMELLNAQPLSREERKQTAELTDETAANMTGDEITVYLERRQTLMTRDFISRDNTLRQTTQQLQSMVTGPVASGGIFGSLAQIGLSTAPVGAGPSAVMVNQGRLLGPTSDRDEISALVDSNVELLSAIADSPDELFKLFSNAMESRYDHVGSRNLSSGITVNTRLRFSIDIGAGSSPVSLNFGPGVYSQVSLLNQINSQITTAGLGSSLLAFFDAQNQLNLRSARSDSQAFLQLVDQSEGSDSVQGLLGLSTGLFQGPDPRVAGGVARRGKFLIDQLSRTGGAIMERIKEGGSFDRRIDGLSKQINTMEERVTEREAALRAKFARLETALGQLQTQQSAISSAVSQLSGGG